MLCIQQTSLRSSCAAFSKITRILHPLFMTAGDLAGLLRDIFAANGELAPDELPEQENETEEETF